MLLVLLFRLCAVITLRVTMIRAYFSLHFRVRAPRGALFALISCLWCSAIRDRYCRLYARRDWCLFRYAWYDIIRRYCYVITIVTCCLPDTYYLMPLLILRWLIFAAICSCAIAFVLRCLCACVDERLLCYFFFIIRLFFACLCRLMPCYFDFSLFFSFHDFIIFRRHVSSFSAIRACCLSAIRAISSPFHVIVYATPLSPDAYVSVCFPLLSLLRYVAAAPCWYMPDAAYSVLFHAAISLRWCCLLAIFRCLFFALMLRYFAFLRHTPALRYAAIVASI